MTWQDLIDDARFYLQDTMEPYRYTTAVLARVLSRALTELARLRSDAYWDLFDRNSLNVPSVAETPSTGETALTEAVSLDVIFHSALIDFVVGMAEVADDEFTVDGRAIVLLERFRTAVMAA